MAKKRKGHTSITEACAYVLQLPAGGLDEFEPLTVAEGVAMSYARRANDGDDHALHILAVTGDASIIEHLWAEAAAREERA